MIEHTTQRADEQRDMIVVRGVSKRFGKNKALHTTDLKVPQGALWGLLGHNGAGKSTLIGMLLGMVFPDSGTIEMDGANVFRKRGAALARTGAIFETPGFYPYLSGLRNLRIFCEYTHPVAEERLWEAARLTGIDHALRNPVRTYSSGMRQRLALAQALVPDPVLLILDEPGNGLDPEGYRDLRNILRHLHSEKGLTILLSSHLLSEVEQLCSHISILHHGRLLFNGSWSAESGRRVRIATDRQAAAEEELVRAGLVSRFESPGTACLGEGRTGSDVAEWLVRKGFRLHLLCDTNRSLEDFYMHATHTDSAEDHDPAAPMAQ